MSDKEIEIINAENAAQNEEWYNNEIDRLKHNCDMIRNLSVFMDVLKDKEGVKFDKEEFLILKAKLEFIASDWRAELEASKATLKTGKELKKTTEDSKIHKKVIKAFLKDLKDIEINHKYITKNIGKQSIDAKAYGGKIKIKEFYKNGNLSSLENEIRNMVERMKGPHYGKTYDERQYNENMMKRNFKSYLEKKIDLEIDRKTKSEMEL